MDQNLNTAANALAAAIRGQSEKDGPTKTYIALEHIDAGSRQYDIGEEIELTEQAAKQPLKLGSVVAKGDKLAAKVVEQNKEKDAREIEEAHAKLEARAKGEEPNNLGYTLKMEKTPASPNPDYRISGVNDEKSTARVPTDKRVSAVRGAPGGPVGRAVAAPAPRGVRVSTGKPASTSGKPPVGGRAKSGRK